MHRTDSHSGRSLWQGGILSIRWIIIAIAQVIDAKVPVSGLLA